MYEENEFKNVTITKKDGDLIALIDNKDLILRLQVNPWTLKVTDFKFSLPNENNCTYNESEG